MKKILILFILLVFQLELNGQLSSDLLFVQSEKDKTEINQFLNNYHLGKVEFLQLNLSTFQTIQNNKSERITVGIPIMDTIVRFEFHKKDILSPDFQLISKNLDIERSHLVPEALYYFSPSDQYNKLAAISIFKDQVMGIIRYKGSTYNLERTQILKGKVQPFTYILYREEDVKNQISFDCQTSDQLKNFLSPQTGLNKSSYERSTSGQIDIYLECDYELYLDKGGNIAQVSNYVTGLFNIVAGIFTNAGGAGMGPTLQISQIVVWESPDPYGAPAANNASEVLEAFSCNLPTYNGRIAHLLSTSNQGLGGIANLPACDGQNEYSRAIHGFSNISTFYNSNLNVYSWSVNVLTHELGHNLGSRHTHACVWNGNNTPIDDCGNIWASNNGNTPEGNNCFDEENPILPEEGTVMSYCRLVSGVGIDLAAGFHPQTAAVISDVSNCLSASISECPIATQNQLSISDLTTSSVTLNCSLTSNISSYYWAYREIGVNGITEIGETTDNQVNVSGLLPNTDYEFTVIVECTDLGWSSASCFFAFQTPCPEHFVLTVNDNPITSGSYEAKEIISGGNIISGSSIHFDASENILLNPNFEIAMNSSFTATIGDGGCSQPVEGYNCFSAMTISTPGTYSTPTLNQGNGASNQDQANHAYWFNYTPTMNVTVNIYSCNQGVDTRVIVYSGNCNSLVFETFSDDACPVVEGGFNYASEILNLSLVANNTYYIEWDDRWSSEAFDWEFEIN